MSESRSGLAEGNANPLDRIELAICLRRAGFDVDYEDWHGLTDDAVRQKVSGVGQEADVQRSPLMQMGISSALYCGDIAMFERAADAGLFASIMEVGDEV